MAEQRVNAVRSYEIGVTDLARSIAFYHEVWGLGIVHQDANSCHLRTTGPEHHAIVLHRRPSVGLIRVNLGAPDRATVDALHAQIQAKGGSVLGSPAPFGGPGGGYGFALRDRDGRELSITSDVARHADIADQKDRVRKLSHVVLNSGDVARSTDFFRDALGFRLSDSTNHMNFLRCSSDHHSIAVAAEGSVTLNHTAWEMPSFDALMYGAGRLKENKYTVEWGIGRHGPGANIFVYFVEPDGYAIEYTAEVEQIDERTHKAGTAEEWQKTPIKRPDRWGFSGPPSERMRQAMHGAAQLAAQTVPA
jgi:catechol 2,3-dioxygenase-like lactoylglutathione lyase family enzyme